MFVVTFAMRARIRKEVENIKRGQRKYTRGLRIPAYLGGDGVPPGHRPRSPEALLNRVDPGVNHEPEDEDD